MFVLPQRRKRPDYPAKLPMWNRGDYPAWHPALLLDLGGGILFAPARLDSLMEDEYTRHNIQRTGVWLCGTLLGVLGAVLLIALDFDPTHWLQLIDLSGIFGLFLWSLPLGLVGAVAVIADRPALFFLSAMTAFFVGLCAGLLAFLIAEVWLRQCYAWRRPWLGHLNLAILLVTQVAGLRLISGYAF